MEGSNYAQESLLNRLVEIDSIYIKSTKRIAYGTAGFRTLGDDLDKICFRAGIFAAIYSKSTGLSGVMITASHNPKQDNGLKIVQKDGSMLKPKYEKLVEDLVNTDDLKSFLIQVNENRKEHDIQHDIFSKVEKHQNLVVIGYDTRESSTRLIRCLINGIEGMKANFVNFHFVTTPQLHWLIAKINEVGTENYQQVKANDFIDEYVKNYKHFIQLIGDKELKNYQSNLILDCSNGIGGTVIKNHAEQLKEYLHIRLINDQDPTMLNELCGAEFVHKDQKLPLNYDEAKHIGQKMASFDGDADRLIYYYQDSQNKKLVIIDGDKQFAFIVMYVKDLIEKLGISDKLSLVLVQTNYCNSRGQKFLKNKGIHQELCPTGVKNAHPIVEKYDIGANDEPNGHGTIACHWNKIDEALKGQEDKIEAQKLRGILSLSNMTVGDAIANLLVIEAILRDLDMSIQDFGKIYQENPSKNFKAVVQDRTKFKVVWDESKLTEPLELQEIVDQKIQEVEEGKAFVRPSGTEDILRIYAEARTIEEMEKLGNDILQEIESKFKTY